MEGYEEGQQKEERMKACYYIHVHVYAVLNIKSLCL